MEKILKFNPFILWFLTLWHFASTDFWQQIFFWIKYFYFIAVGAFIWIFFFLFLSLCIMNYQISQDKFYNVLKLLFFLMKHWISLKLYPNIKYGNVASLSEQMENLNQFGTLIRKSATVLINYIYFIQWHALWMNLLAFSIAVFIFCNLINSLKKMSFLSLCNLLKILSH